MAKVCVVPENKATIRIFEVNSESKADILVYIVDKDYKAKNDCLWYISDRSDSKTTDIAYVNSESKADLKVFFVKNDYKAKWLKPNKWKSRL